MVLRVHAAERGHRRETALGGELVEIRRRDQALVGAVLTDEHDVGELAAGARRLRAAPTDTRRARSIAVTVTLLLLPRAS